jgi:hypothetical protein
VCTAVMINKPQMEELMMMMMIWNPEGMLTKMSAEKIELGSSMQVEGKNHSREEQEQSTLQVSSVGTMLHLIRSRHVPDLPDGRIVSSRRLQRHSGGHR